MPFTENWYSDGQLVDLCRLYDEVRDVPGLIVEFGCWQGKSTVALANACYPDRVRAVDHWRGNIDESPENATVALARERDVYAEFVENIRMYTKGNVDVFRMDWRSFIKELGPRPQNAIKFCHIDASHDYPSVRDNIAAVLPLLASRAVLCGDDFQSASSERFDLHGGVERAVRELLNGFRSNGNLWYWMKNESK